MNNQIDFPALLQTLARQDWQLRDSHSQFHLYPGDDFVNIWVGGQPNLYLETLRNIQAQVFQHNDPAGYEVLEQRMLEEREYFVARLPKYSTGRCYDWDGLRHTLESRSVRNVSIMATMPLVEPTRAVMNGTSSGIYPIREPYLKKVTMINEDNQESNYTLTVVDTVDVQEYLPQSGVEYTLAEEHGIFIDIEVKTAEEHNLLLDNLVSRFGAGIFSDGEIPDRAE